MDHILHDLICEQGNLHVVVDAKGLLHADTDGVSVLVDACRLAHQCGAILTVRNASEAVRWVLDEWSIDEQVVAIDQAGLHLASI